MITRAEIQAVYEYTCGSHDHFTDRTHRLADFALKAIECLEDIVTYSPMQLLSKPPKDYAKFRAQATLELIKKPESGRVTSPT